MEIPVTRTKVLLPRRPAELLTRERLLELMFDLLDHKLIILSAPAGYGKTTLLIDFAHQVELPVCWYALDELDRDPQRFLVHFIASLAERFPELGKRSTIAHQNMTSADLNIDRIVTTLVNEIYDHIREYFIVILDDYHLVDTSKTINEFINQFTQKVDENCHVILSSRSLLSLRDLPLMVARSQVAGLGSDELVFRTDEIQALVLQNYHATMPESVAQELATETEGWITGLLLSAKTMWQGMIDRVRVARVSGVGLYDYLAQQVLDQQPAPVRDFLLRTSLLEEFDAGLCEAVLGSGEDWPRLIETVLRNNLFVLPVDDQGTWLRYHHLFRDFLQERVAQELPTEQDRLLRRLAAVYAERREWEKAHAAYQRLEDETATADLIEQAGSPMIKSGRLATLTEWFDTLPATALVSRPGLSSLRGIVAVMLGDVKPGLSLLNEAESAFRTAGDRSRLARTLERQAVAHRFLGQYDMSLADAEEALSLTARDESLCIVHANALRAKGLSLYWMGQLAQAVEWLERSLTSFVALDNQHDEARVRVELGMACRRSGDIDRALAHYEQALAYWTQADNIVRQATLLNNLGVLYHFKGEYERARALLEEALDKALKSGYSRIGALALTSIGDLYADLDARKAAEDAYLRAYDTAQRTDDRFLQLYLNLARAGIARSKGSLGEANRLLEMSEKAALGSDSQYQQGLWELEAGRLALAEEDISGGIAHLENATQCFRDGGQRVDGARAQLFLADAYQAAGNAEASLTCLDRAFRSAGDADGQRALVVPGRQVKPVLEAAMRDTSLGSRASQLMQQVTQFENEIPALRRRLRRRTTAIPLGPPKLIIYALGEAQVKLDGKGVIAPEWQSRRNVRELFFLLLAHPDGLSKERVGEILWPDVSPAQLKLRFKNAIYRLRRALGQDVVLFHEDRYQFNRTLDYEYDAEAFLRKLEQASTAPETEQQIAAYQDAIGLYNGSYLPDVDGTWVWPERERLSQAYLDAASKIAEYYLEMADHTTALHYCQRALSEDPCFEAAHRVTMRVHAAVGNRPAVVQQFNQCRKILLEEIGTSPSPQTEALFKTLTH